MKKLNFIITIILFVILSSCGDILNDFSAFNDVDTKKAPGNSNIKLDLGDSYLDQSIQLERSYMAIPAPGIQDIQPVNEQIAARIEGSSQKSFNLNDLVDGLQGQWYVYWNKVPMYGRDLRYEKTFHTISNGYSLRHEHYIFQKEGKGHQLKYSAFGVWSFEDMTYTLTEDEVQGNKAFYSMKANYDGYDQFNMFLIDLTEDELILSTSKNSMEGRDLFVLRKVPNQIKVTMNDIIGSWVPMSTNYYDYRYMHLVPHETISAYDPSTGIPSVADIDELSINSSGDTIFTLNENSILIKDGDFIFDDNGHFVTRGGIEYDLDNIKLIEGTQYIQIRSGIGLNAASSATLTYARVEVISNGVLSLVRNGSANGVVYHKK